MKNLIMMISFLFLASCAHRHHGGHHDHGHGHDQKCADGKCAMKKDGEKKSCCDGTKCEMKDKKDCCADGKAKPSVWFVEPKDGATVPSEFVVKFGVRGYEILPAGQMKEGTGHHHLLINTVSIDKGKAIPADEKHLHFGQGQTETKVKLAKGTHKLTLQFADGAHLSYGESLSSTITVHVK